MLTMKLMVVTLFMMTKLDMMSGRVVKRESDGLTKAEKTQFLDRHNLKRNNVSPRAALMTKMIWDSDLAAAAQAWANGCSKQHDYNSGSGENLYMSSNRPTPYEVVDSWHDEEKWYNLDSNTCNPPPGHSCGHYTQVVWVNSHKLGCGMKKCGDNSYFVVCRYSPPGNMNGQPPYEAGAPCSKCTSSSTLTGKCWNNLCLTTDECNADPASCVLENKPCGGKLIDCQNGGVANYDTCGCDCGKYHTGSQCEKYNCANMGDGGKDKSSCSWFWGQVGQAMCSDGMMAGDGQVIKYGHCPQTCKLCP